MGPIYAFLLISAISNGQAQRSWHDFPRGPEPWQLSNNDGPILATYIPPPPQNRNRACFLESPIPPHKEPQSTNNDGSYIPPSSPNRNRARFLESPIPPHEEPQSTNNDGFQTSQEPTPPRRLIPPPSLPSHTEENQSFQNNYIPPPYQLRDQHSERIIPPTFSQRPNTENVNFQKRIAPQQERNKIIHTTRNRSKAYDCRPTYQERVTRARMRRGRARLALRPPTFRGDRVNKGKRRFRPQQGLPISFTPSRPTSGKANEKDLTEIGTMTDDLRSVFQKIYSIEKRVETLENLVIKEKVSEQSSPSPSSGTILEKPSSLHNKTSGPTEIAPFEETRNELTGRPTLQLPLLPKSHGLRQEKNILAQKAQTEISKPAGLKRKGDLLPPGLNLDKERFWFNKPYIKYLNEKSPTGDQQSLKISTNGGSSQGSTSSNSHSKPSFFSQKGNQQNSMHSKKRVEVIMNGGGGVFFWTNQKKPYIAVVTSEENTSDTDFLNQSADTPWSNMQFSKPDTGHDPVFPHQSTGKDPGELSGSSKPITKSEGQKKPLLQTSEESTPDTDFFNQSADTTWSNMQYPKPDTGHDPVFPHQSTGKDPGELSGSSKPITKSEGQKKPVLQTGGENSDSGSSVAQEDSAMSGVTENTPEKVRVETGRKGSEPDDSDQGQKNRPTTENSPV